MGWFHGSADNGLIMEAVVGVILSADDDDDDKDDEYVGGDGLGIACVGSEEGEILMEEEITGEWGRDSFWLIAVCIELWLLLLLLSKFWLLLFVLRSSCGWGQPVKEESCSWLTG